ncbi:MAG TPA: hypothetical protein VKJ65_03985 [Phycisphaerae bacterium]|nr:hypothetical protein [Phycisphaerae bacterium]
MVMQSAKRFCLGAIVLSASFACLAPVQAAFDGSPVGGPATATDNNGPGNIWTSNLYPNPAIQEATCVWIDQGLAAQGFAPKIVNGVNTGWTINTGVPLSGALSIETYYAWATNQPSETINGTKFGGKGPLNDFGGADFRILYTPGAGDPGTPGQPAAHWMQAIYTNSALNPRVIANAFSYGNGYYAYLDNGGTYGTNPDYDNNVGPNPTTSTEFLDLPNRQIPFPNPSNYISWYAQVFIDTFNPTTKTINVYTNGIYWGFSLTDVSPEPQPLAYMMLGLVGLVLRRRWRWLLLEQAPLRSACSKNRKV